MNSTLLNACISALSWTDRENKFFVYSTDEAAGTAEYCVNIAGPCSVESLEGLNDLVLMENVLQMTGFDPLGEDWVSSAINFGNAEAE